MVRVEVVDADVGGLVHGVRAGRGARIHQIPGHFRLAVDHDVAPGQRGEIHAVTAALEQDVEAVVDQTLACQPIPHTGAAQQVHHPLFEDARAHAGQHVAGAAAFDDDRVDAGAMEKLPEQEAGRAGPHDGNLDARGLQRPPSSL